MAKSFRLDPALGAQLARAAQAEGTSTSESIRRAIAQYCEEVLGNTLHAKLADVIGIGHGGGGRARRSGEAFRRVLRQRRRKGS